LALTLDTSAAPGGVVSRPDADCEMFVFSFTAGADNDTFNPGFVSTGRNAIRFAYRLTALSTTRTMSVTHAPATGVFSFDFSAGTDNVCELYVWVR
jgi:hypothetical protein